MHSNFEHSDGLTDPALAWDKDDTAGDRAYEHWLDEKLGIAP